MGLLSAPQAGARNPGGNRKPADHRPNPAGRVPRGYPL